MRSAAAVFIVITALLIGALILTAIQSANEFNECVERGGTVTSESYTSYIMVGKIMVPRRSVHDVCR